MSQGTLLFKRVQSLNRHWMTQLPPKHEISNSLSKYRQGAAALHVEVLIAPWSVLQLVLCRLAGSSTLVALLATSTAVIALELFQVLRVAILVEGATWSPAPLHGWYRFNNGHTGRNDPSQQANQIIHTCVLAPVHNGQGPQNYVIATTKRIPDQS